MRSTTPIRSCLWWVQLVVLVFSGAGCAQEVTAPVVKDPVRVDVARVNHETISVAELAQFLQPESLSNQRPETLKAGLLRLIRQKILAHEARKAGFSVSIEEAREFRWLGQKNEQVKEPDSSLRRAQDYLVIQKFLQDRLQAEQQITLRQLLRHYEENQDEYQIDDQYRVLEILVQDHKEAEQIRRELAPGDFRQFHDTAKQSSIGVGAELGGDLGLFKRGELPAGFEEVIFKLKVGEVSEVFHSELGYHVFTIEELIPRHAQKFYEVQEQIFEQLVSERERKGLDKLLNQMMESASIEIFDLSWGWNWRKSDVQLP